MSGNVSCWDLIVQKRFEEACIKADEEYITTKNEPHLRNKAIALLNLKKYNEVLDIALELIELTNGKSDSDYALAGIAKWLIGNYMDAVNMWKAGLDTPYTDAAGGIGIPSLLYFAAIKLEDSSLEKEVIGILRKKYKSKRALNFPGAIAGYLLGKINENKLLDTYISMEELKTRVLCKSYFYIAANALKKNNIKAYLENLENCKSNETYLEKEYFLAMGELDKMI
ncbi:MAG: hypothetical protein ACYDG2_24120 [Ruminiclostridium sp.]